MCSVFKKVCIELLCFADSNRSLIKDAIDLFRIFQRVSASRSFFARFSSDCYKLFEWATNFINMISEALIPKEHLSMYELFQLYCLDSNIFMANFLLILLCNHKYVTFIPLFGLALLFGVGYSYSKTNGLYLVIFLIIAAVISILSIFGLLVPKVGCFSFIFCSFDEGIIKISEDGIDSSNNEEALKYTMMMLAGGIVFACTTSSIIIRHRVIGIYILLIISAVVIATLIYELISFCCKKPPKVSKYIIQLVNQIIGLCLVPATEAFIQLVLTNFGVRWNVVLSYVILTVIFPIVITVILILSDYEDLQDSYKPKKNCFDYRYVETIDILHKIIYAMLAALDIPYGCIAIEGAWLIFMIVLRPYTSYSDSILNFGESIIMILGNIAAVVGSGFFSFEVSITFVAIACTPVIFSIIAYFAFEFELPEKEENSLDELSDGENEKSDKKTESIRILAFSFAFFAPLSWFLFGTNVKLMYSTVVIN